MNKEDRFESIRIDLRPFGWGIRDVGVIWPDDHQGGDQPGPDSVGTEQIQDDSVMMDDLHQSVKDKMMTDDDRVTQEDINNFNV